MDTSSDTESNSAASVQMKNPTLSEMLMSEEERQARLEYKLIKAELCLSEAWKLYHKLTQKWTTAPPKQQPEPEPEPTPSPEDPSLEPKISTEDGSQTSVSDHDSVVLDEAEEEPEKFPVEESQEVLVDLRPRQHLEKKFKFLLDGLQLLVKATERPYLLTQKVREVDYPTRRLSMPRAIRSYRPEVFNTTSVPFESTCSYTKTWTDVANLNFQVVRQKMISSTQTDPTSLLASASVKRNSLYFADFEDDTEVDLLDIPLDDDGNPVGKRTGYCEWCGQDILPMPTPMTLSEEWDRRLLYCCSQYQKMVETLVQLEQTLQRAKDEQEILIDVKRRVQAPETLNPEKVAKKRFSTVASWVVEAMLKRRAAQEASSKGRQHQLVDTSDLPWDPYETRFNAARPAYNDKIFNDDMEHVYRHAEIVLQQSEVYETPMYSDLGDLKTITQE